MSDAITIRPLTTPSDMGQAEDLQRLVWQGSETDVIPKEFLIALAHNGGLVLGGLDEGRLVGLVVGFLGTDEEHPDRVAMARLKHCSHLLAVDPHYRARGLGYRLKCAQREAVIQQGIRLVTWTYDPLLSLNAHLNIRRLGAVCRRYLRDAYGVMRDEMNAGGLSDRFQVDWWVTSQRVTVRLEGARRPLDLVHFLEAGAEKVNPASLGLDDLPRPAETISPLGGNLLLVEIPPDFLTLKKRDLGLAMAWRMHTREIFERAFEAGYLAVDFVHLRGETFPRSYYLLSHGESTLG
jgi:predicted GNAT superfamily acetyltransferase